jgi:hypothetical protein
MSFEHDVFEMHKAGRLDASLVEFFLPGGQIRNIEGPMWDYKVGFCHPNATVHEESLLLCELLHDIVGLYNAFGGYLIIAFTDPQAPRFAKLTNKTTSTSSLTVILEHTFQSRRLRPRQRSTESR